MALTTAIRARPYITDIVLTTVGPGTSVPRLNLTTPLLGVTPPSAESTAPPWWTGTLSTTSVAAAGPRLATANV